MPIHVKPQERVLAHHRKFLHDAQAARRRFSACVGYEKTRRLQAERDIAGQQREAFEKLRTVMREEVARARAAELEARPAERLRRAVLHQAGGPERAVALRQLYAGLPPEDLARAAADASDPKAFDPAALSAVLAVCPVGPTYDSARRAAVAPFVEDYRAAQGDLLLTQLLVARAEVSGAFGLEDEMRLRDPIRALQLHHEAVTVPDALTGGVRRFAAEDAAALLQGLPLDDVRGEVPQDFHLDSALGALGHVTMDFISAARSAA